MQTDHEPEHATIAPRPGVHTQRPATWRVLRWAVSVDDRPHRIGGGQILHVDSRHTGAVEVWTLELVDNTTAEAVAEKRTVQVFGTGQALPAQHRGHLGSTLDGPLVWHVFLIDTTPTTTAEV